MKDNILIRRLAGDEIRSALDLAWSVFLEFEAPEYPEEGVRTFRTYLDGITPDSPLQFYGAFEETALLGTIWMREPQHIGGFFVQGCQHRQGIGKALLKHMMQDYSDPVFTVNASPYAVKIYKHLGFAPTSEEQLADGIRFTPMEYRRKEEAKADDPETVLEGTPKYPKRAAEQTFSSSLQSIFSTVYAGPSAPTAVMTYAGPGMMTTGFSPFMGMKAAMAAENASDSPLPTPGEDIICGKCGTKNHAGAKFCGGCGIPLLTDNSGAQK